MSAAYAPEPDGPEEPARGELSVRDRRILDEIAGYENGSDPGFVARLQEPGPRRPASPLTERVVQILIVAVVAGLLLPTAWVMVGVVVTVLVVMPAVLVWYGRRMDGGNRAGRGPQAGA